MYAIRSYYGPEWDEDVVREEVITLVIQINGKVRDKIEVIAGQDDEQLRNIALSSEKVIERMEGKSPRNVIIVRGQLVV